MILFVVFQIVTVNIVFLLNFKTNAFAKDMVMTWTFTQPMLINFYSSASFTAPPAAPTPQHHNVTTDSRNLPASLGPPTPRRNAFVPNMAGVTEETAG